jgi:aminoglycoside 6'-N-acetyltransferase I
MSVIIRECTSPEDPDWLAQRIALWPEDNRAAHLVDMARLCAEPARFAQFIAYSVQGEARGFIEVALRIDYVNGTESSPVGFVEGVYVVPEARRQGIARALVAGAERWALSRGCTEMASDALLDNHVSHATHLALGFQETERVVYFRKLLTPR